MPIKGVLLIMVVAVVAATVYRDEIYDSLKQYFSADEDNNNSEEENE